MRISLWFFCLPITHNVLIVLLFNLRGMEMFLHSTSPHETQTWWHLLKHFSCVLSLVSLYHQSEYLYMFLSLWNKKHSQNGGQRRHERIEQDQLVWPGFYSIERVPIYHEKTGHVVFKQTDHSRNFLVKYYRQRSLTTVPNLCYNIFLICNTYLFHLNDSTISLKIQFPSIKCRIKRYMNK